MKKLTIYLIMILFLVASSSYAQGRDRGFGEGQRFNKPQHQNFGRNLSDQQKAALEEFKQNKEALRAKAEELKLARKELELYISSSSSDESSVRSKLAEVNSLMSEINNIRVESVLKLKSQLEPKQFSKMMKKMKEKMKHKKHDKGFGGKQRKSKF